MGRQKAHSEALLLNRGAEYVPADFFLPKNKSRGVGPPRRPSVAGRQSDARSPHQPPRNNRHIGDGKKIFVPTEVLEVIRPIRNGENLGPQAI